MAGDRDRKIVEARKAEGWLHDQIVEIFLDEGMDEDEAEALVASVSAAPAPRRHLPPGRDGPRNRGPQTAKQLDWQAPFRFAPLNEKVLKPQAEVARLLRHDLADGEGLLSTPLKDGYSGQIKIDIAFDGPMLIGQAEGDVQKPLEIGARHCIPGATLRGLIRSTLEIAAFARLTQTNMHRRFATRDFGHPNMKERTDPNAGWLTCDNPDAPEDRRIYSVQQCEWRLIRIRDLRGEGGGDSAWHLNWLGNKLEDRYGYMKMKHGTDCFDFSVTSAFAPHSQAASFSGPVPHVSPTSDDDAAFRGVYVFSDSSPAFIGKMDETRRRRLIGDLDAQESQVGVGQHKKRECVFASVGYGDQIAIPPAVWRNFIANNSRPSLHAPKPDGSWKKLRPTLIAGQRIPVFWVGDGEVGDFGLSRVFKRSHDNSIGEMLKRTGDKAHLPPPDRADPDFVEAMFGYVREPAPGDDGVQAQMHEDRHLKGRVAFGFAWLDDPTPKTTAELATIMAAPKPSFAPFYVSGRVKDWSDPNARLAGRKRYPAKGADAADVAEFLNDTTGEIKDSHGSVTPAWKRNASVQSRLIFLEPKPDRPLRFQGEILVHNVTAEELGALLWALTFGGKDGLRHMIGRAKAAGAGQAQITASLDVAAHAPDAAAPKADDLMARFEALMGREVQGWATSPPVKALLACADPSKAAAMGRLRYMPLKKHKPLNDAVGPNARGGAAKATLLEP
jgi:hypothetical protein